MKKRKPNGWWTDDECARAKAEAKKYDSRSELKRANGSAYYALKDRGHLPALYGEPKLTHWRGKLENRKPHRYWRWDDCKNSLKAAKDNKRLTRSQFSLEFPAAYIALCDNGLMDKAFPK